MLFAAAVTLPPFPLWVYLLQLIWNKFWRLKLWYVIFIFIIISRCWCLWTSATATAFFISSGSFLCSNTGLYDEWLWLTNPHQSAYLPLPPLHVYTVYTITADLSDTLVGVSYHTTCTSHSWCKSLISLVVTLVYVLLCRWCFSGQFLEGVEYNKLTAFVWCTLTQLLEYLLFPLRSLLLSGVCCFARAK